VTGTRDASYILGLLYENWRFSRKAKYARLRTSPPWRLAPFWRDCPPQPRLRRRRALVALPADGGAMGSSRPTVFLAAVWGDTALPFRQRFARQTAPCHRQRQARPAGAGRYVKERCGKSTNSPPHGQTGRRFKTPPHGVGAARFPMFGNNLIETTCHLARANCPRTFSCCLYRLYLLSPNQFPDPDDRGGGPYLFSPGFPLNADMTSRNAA